MSACADVRHGRSATPPAWLCGGREGARANEFAAGKSRSPPARTVRHGEVPRHRHTILTVRQLKPCSQSASARDRAYRRPSGGFTRSGRDPATCIGSCTGRPSGGFTRSGRKVPPRVPSRPASRGPGSRARRLSRTRLRALPAVAVSDPVLGPASRGPRFRARPAFGAAHTESEKSVLI